MIKVMTVHFTYSDDHRTWRTDNDSSSKATAEWFVTCVNNRHCIKKLYFSVCLFISNAHTHECTRFNQRFNLLSL